jgi:hypothetical protein
MQTLRNFLSVEHANGVGRVRVLVDTNVADPLLEERLHHIRAQVMSALVLRSVLADLGLADENENRLDLAYYVDRGAHHGILGRREVGIFMVLNARANVAKHELAFRSCL